MADSESSVHNGSVVYDPWQAHVYEQDELKGIVENPCILVNILLRYINLLLIMKESN